MINNVVLVGRLTKDAELRYTPSNVAVATFTLAVNRNRKNENGDLFEPVYKCKIKAIPKSDVFYTSLTRLKDNIKDLQEIKKFFEFVRENKENLFEMAGFKGALE